MWMNIMNIPRKEMGNRLANIGHHKPVVFFVMQIPVISVMW